MVRCLSFGVGCRLCAVFLLVFVLLRVARCFFVCCALFVVRRLLCVVGGLSLCGVRCCLCDVCCLLRVVCCPLFVVYRLLR